MASSRALRRLALGLTAALLAFVAPATALAAPSIGGFSARALGPHGEPTPQTYFQQTLAPGDTFKGTLLVTNTSPKAQTLRVDSVDGLTGNTSGTVYANREDPRKGASLWITPEKGTLHMDGKSDRTITFTVKVPDDATPGDHVGAIALQKKFTPKAKGQFGVKEVIRVAVAVSIRVKGDAVAALKPTKLGLKALGGTQIPNVETTLQNTGQLLCRPTIVVTLAQNGTSIGSERRTLDTLLPGVSIPYPMPWNRPLAAGTYHATAETSGCGAPAKIEADLVLKGALSGSKATPGTDTLPAPKGGGVPWWALVIVAVIALVGGFFLARRKPREAKPTDEAPAT